MKFNGKTMTVFAELDTPAYDVGYKEGKQAEWECFWDEYQDKGNRTNYAKAFCGSGWTDATFRPKHDFLPSSCDEMFRGAAIIDIVGILKQAGVTLDTSQAQLFSHMFSNTNIEEAPHLDLTKASNVHYLFNACYKLKKASLTFAESTISDTKYMFSGCSSLENLVIGGVIDKGISLGNSPMLTAESVQSVIDALKDLTGETAQTLGLNKGVVANMTDAQKATITAKNWTLVY